MCGIAGFFSTTARSPEVAARMLASLTPRGPDAQEGQFWDADFQASTGGVHNALLHTRLAIIDPHPRSNQPMRNHRGDVWISYNGEVYGWQEDARLLTAMGYTFDTSCDTEFILHAYEAWGIDMLPRLRGKFAIALLDLRQQCLWLISDRLGQKPIVYHHDGEDFGFASTLRALLPFLPIERRSFDHDAIDAYLAHRYIPTPATIIKSIRRLPPGHHLRFDLRRREVEIQSYWQANTAADDAPSWQDELTQAVALRTVADRPIGLLLSGGIDSTVLAWLLTETGHRDITAYTVAFADPSFDEAPLARQIAARLQMKVQTLDFCSDWCEDFTQIVAALDEPFADPSAFPLWLLIRQLSPQVKVVLSGDGGDELLAGYKRYRQHLRSAWRPALPLPVIADARAKGWRKTLCEASMPWTEAYSLRFSGMIPNQRHWLQPDFQGRRTYWRYPDPLPADPRQQLLAIDRMNALPDYILRKADLCSMAHGVELRAPFMDHRFIEALTCLDSRQLYTQPPKALLRQICPLIDEMQLLKNKKRGFSPPLAQGLRLKMSARLDGLGERLKALSSGQIDAGRTDQMIQGWRLGCGAQDEQILQLLILDESLRQLNSIG